MSLDDPQTPGEFLRYALHVRRSLLTRRVGTVVTVPLIGVPGRTTVDVRPEIEDGMVVVRAADLSSPPSGIDAEVWRGMAVLAKWPYLAEAGATTKVSGPRGDVVWTFLEPLAGVREVDRLDTYGRPIFREVDLTKTPYRMTCTCGRVRYASKRHLRHVFCCRVCAATSAGDTIS